MKQARLLFLPLFVVALGLLTGCSTGPRKDEWDGLRLTTAPPNPNPPMGEGLKGRMVDGKKVYTVMVKFLVSKEGKVVHAEVDRSDAPQRLQWGAVKAIRRLQFGPSSTRRAFRQTIIFHDLVVKDG